MDLNTARQPGSNASTVYDQLQLAIVYWQDILANSFDVGTTADATAAITLLQNEAARVQDPPTNVLSTVVPV